MLIKCPECEKEISEKAKYCPHCGCPNEKVRENEPPTQKQIDYLNVLGATKKQMNGLTKLKAIELIDKLKQEPASEPLSKKKKSGCATLLLFIFFIFLPGIFMVLGLIGCSGSQSANNDKTLDDLISYLKKKGLRVGEPETQFYQLIGANNGYAIDVNGKTVEIYKYDLDVSKQKKIINEARKTGKMIAMDMSMPVENNGSFILVFVKKHPDKEKIKNIFKEF